MFWTLVKRSAAKRIPVIRFRRGGNEATGVNQSATQNQQVSGVAIEDWQLPARYRRLPFTEEEIEYINRGGRA